MVSNLLVSKTEYNVIYPEAVELIIWDFGGPIYVRSGGLEKAVARQCHLAVKEILGCSYREAAGMYDEMYEETSMARKTLRDLTGEDRFDGCMDAVDASRHLGRDYEMRDFILEQNARGRKSVVLTSGPLKFTTDAIQTVFGMNPFVDVIAAEELKREVGAVKPNDDVFRYVSDKLGVDPRACLSIGDEPLKDIEPAIKVGMQGYYLDREGPIAWPLLNLYMRRAA